MEGTTELCIGICDDEKIVLESLKRIVKECLEELKVHYSLFSFECGKKLLQEAGKLDIVFLDIAMPEMDGIAVGRELKKENKDCKIIIASSMVERFKETYSINTFRFITKPYEKEEIKEALTAMIEQETGLQTVEVYKERKKYHIAQRKIKYIMAYDGYVELKAGDYIFRKESSLNEMETFLNKEIFFRIHKQYLINFLWVDEYKNNTIKIEEKEFRIARRKRALFDKKYMEFDLNYR